jgi:hypothetical protein
MGKSLSTSPLITASTLYQRLLAAGAVLLSVVAVGGTQAPGGTPAAPPTLQDTGLYSDFDSQEVAPQHLAFSPQYPLWTDGAKKRRWISLPAGTRIDASDPDAWVFPIGTRLWKEFSFAGQPVETRYMQRQPDGQWLYAAYAWSPDGREALLTSEKGKRGAFALAADRSHAIPSVSDCKACHQGGLSQVLGFSALQLSQARDPGALHAEPGPSPDLDINYLVEKGLLVGLPQRLLENPPQIAAASPAERAALGYMHGNCGHCHNEQGSLKNLGLYLRHVSAAAVPPAVTSTVAHPVKKPAPGQSSDAVLRIEPGHPERSALMQRVASRYPALQMPPLGTELVDTEAVKVMRQWISEELDVHSKKEKENRS